MGEGLVEMLLRLLQPGTVKRYIVGVGLVEILPSLIQPRYSGEVHCGCGSGRDSTQSHTAQVQRIRYIVGEGLVEILPSLIQPRYSGKVHSG